MLYLLANHKSFIHIIKLFLQGDTYKHLFRKFSFQLCLEEHMEHMLHEYQLFDNCIEPI